MNQEIVASLRLPSCSFMPLLYFYLILLLFWLLPPGWSSLNINCGGKGEKIGDTNYDDDTQPGGPSKLYQSGTNWAFSSTGHFADDNHNLDSYIKSSDSGILGNEMQLYSDARLSPLSLTYYGFCLVNGNYTVKLHFAEIMFTDDRTYSSLGRRVFDIYMQVFIGFMVLSAMKFQIFKRK